jgi:hypothetical protein
VTPLRFAPKARALGAFAFALLAASFLLALRALFPAPARAQELGPVHRIPGGPFEASGIVAPPGGKGLLFVDDARPEAVLWLTLAADGSPKAAPVAIPLGVSVADPEGLTSDGRFVYVAGSQSRGKGTKGPGVVRFRFDAERGAAQNVEAIADLASIVEAALPAPRAAKGKKGAELNIEGLAWDAKRGRLLLGLRAPLAGKQAVLVPVRLRDANGPFAAANLAVEEPIRLDLGGAGVRGIEADAEGDFWIVAGGSTGNPIPSRVVRWDGGGSAVRDVATLPANLKAEGIVRVPLGGKTVSFVLCDTSQYVLVP